MKKVAVICIISLLLHACVSKQVVMSNTEGKQYNCSAHGFGLLGSMMAASIFDDCVLTAKAKGYN